jgi:NADPH2 dehydrogenase
MTVTKPLLFTPIKVGALTLAHRVAMAPLTRFRANPKTFVPSPLSTEYYRQRASPGGLMISEATFVAEEAGGFAGAPGIWSQEQVAQWKEVTEAVHAKGGLIFLQLWALG